jgi:NAD(P)-dependent dehydrogenase (short-subunit alcohol dehydrogenase family)
MKGKVVVVSGASRGLGRALALGFGGRGASVGICARDKTRLASVEQQLKSMNAPCVSLAIDISNDASAREFINRVIGTFGRIDVLINNASILGARSEIVSYPSRVWDEIMRININGAFYLTKYALRIMLEQNEGSIINVSSSVGRKARRTWGGYAVSKFALEGLTEVVADELDRKTSIRVNSVNPGAIATDMRREAYPTEDQNTLKKPDDILDVFFYLASDESAGVTGQRFDAQSFQINEKANV